jgi:hypothetical protein
MSDELANRVRVSESAFCAVEVFQTERRIGGLPGFNGDGSRRGFGGASRIE